MPTEKEREELRNISKELYDNRCFVCHKKRGKGFLFHHLFYTRGQYTYRDKGYHKNLINDIRSNPKQFLLLCKKHHFVIETMKKYSYETFIRLSLAILLSNEIR